MKELLPLTEQQKNIWNIEMFYSNTAINNVGGFLCIEQKVDFKSLQEAVNLYVKHNDSCRLHFVSKDSQVFQYVSNFSKFDIDIIDVKNKKEAEKLAVDSLNEPFEVYDSNLFKFNLFRLPNGKGGFTVAFHHLISDAWTIGLFLTRVMDIYSSLLKDNVNVEDFPKYSEYVLETSKYMNSKKFDKDREYWENTFNTEPNLTYIYKDKSNNFSPIDESNGAREICQIDKKLSSEISIFCKEHNVSMYTFFMAIYLLYLAKINDSNSAILGTPVLNRTNFNEKQIAGMFVSTVPFKMDIDSSEKFSDFLKNVAINQSSIFRHQKYPYLNLLEHIKSKYDLSENLYDFVLSYQNAKDNKNSCDVPYNSEWVYNKHVSSSLETHFYDMDDSGTASIFYNYQTCKFTKKDIQDFHKRIINMANFALKDTLIKDIPVITSDEEKEINKFNNSFYKYDKDTTIVELFEKQVRKNKEKTAVIFKDKTLSYDELDKESNKLANYLLSKGVKKDDIIGIMFNRNFNIYIAMWAILKTGASYMLIDPTLPKDRVDYMLENAKSPFVITDLYLNYETVNIKDSNGFSDTLPNVLSSNQDRFCIIYTSGSTGTPKGVELRRLSVINVINSYRKILNADKCNMFLSTCSLAFDMFIVETFTPFLTGKTLILADEDEQKIPAFTSKLIEKYNIDFMLVTASKLSLLLEEGECLKNVKVMQLGGEVIKPTLYKELRKVTNADIFDGYGPSECCACSSNKKITSENDINIGTPFFNVKLYIMNKDNNILPINVPGELVISGDGVGFGYLGKDRFGKYYRTGDIAKLNPNLELDYIGRKDNQIKLHGLRIELDEITEKLISLGFISNAVSVIKKVNNSDAICSYVILSDNSHTESEIKKLLSDKLPNYMVPSHIVFMDKFPITLNGKIDTKNLPDVKIEDAEFTESSSKTEKELEKIWAKALGLEKISTTANFFEIGGDSLASIRIVSEIYSKLHVKIEIKDIFEKPTIVELAKYIDENDTQETKTKRITKVNVSSDKLYPITASQRGIYYTVSRSEDNISYNTPFGILFNKVPDVKKLENAINTIINSNQAFRTYFVVENNDVYQKVCDKVDFKLKVSNSKNDDFVKPFDLSKAPLIHIELDKFDKKALLQIDIHHIICDGVSIGIFADQLCKLYNGESIKENKLDYIDYAVKEQINEDDKEYWVSQFKSGVPLLNMPTEYERSNQISESGKSIFDKLENGSKINDFCKKRGITPYMFLLSCYYSLLYKYTMQNDIVVGTPAIGRDNDLYSNVIGMFVNTLALRQNIQGTLTFEHFCDLVKNNCMSAFAHQKYPFEELIKNIDILRDNSRRPLFDVFFSYESGGLPELNLNDLDTEYVIPENKTSKFDFTLEITPDKENFNIRLEYSNKLFSKNFMQNLLRHYKNIIDIVLENPDIQISKINMLKETKEIYPKLDIPRDVAIIDLFEKQVKKTPNKIALVFGDEKYTYKELETKVNMLANYIKNLPIYKNEISKADYKVIGVMMNRRSELIISILAALKVGAGYLPIDPTYPEDRVKYIIEDSGVKLLLSEEAIKSNFGIKKINVDNSSSFAEYKEFHENISQDDLAYLIYTSGSTGKPKGVLIKQLGVVNFIYACLKDMPLQGKTIVNITTMCFDIFVFESLLPLCTGMKVVLASNEEQTSPILLNKLCLKNKVQVIQTTPSKFKFLMTDNLEYLKNLEVISLIGEAFPLELFKQIKEVTNSRVYNMYGPTETTVGSTLKELVNVKEPITIGTPLANTSIFVLDNDLNPVPENVPGKLFIGGLGMTMGYMNKPEITAERYIDYNGQKIYDTGDLVKLLPNGELECLGRVDFQVKVRGLRIELLEIENTIRSYKNIQDVVVTVKNIKGRDILCGYFTAISNISISLLKNYISKKLPNYMVPTYLMQIKEFTYTPNGKIDRKFLPEPKIENKEIILPKTPLEKKLVNICESILSLEKISTSDNFFEIGGDSLCALKLQLELMKLGYNVNYGDIFKNNTVVTLAKFIDNQETKPVITYKKKDFKKINKVLRKNNTFKKLKLKRHELKDVLLIGATGFLGIHCISELLKNDNIKIYCLVREDISTSSENKLKNKFKYYFGSDLSNLFGKRIFVFNGDISKENFGLSPEEYDFLGNNVTHILNCAALVKHYGDYSVFEKINVTGVKNIIDFCEKYDKEFFQTSTISVSGNTMTGLAHSYNPNKKVYFGETNLFVGQALDNVYVRSKFEAEKIILEEIAEGRLKGMILRIGNITNRYFDGKFQENSDDNAFLNRLKAFIALEMIPDTLLDKYIEFTPVDKVSEAIVESMLYYTSPYSVLHLYNSKHLYINDLYKILCNLNINVKIVENETFKKKLNKWLYDSSKSDKVNVLLNDLDKDNNLVYSTNLITTNKFTLKFLDKIDFDWPTIDIEYIKKILQNL